MTITVQRALRNGHSALLHGVPAPRYWDTGEDDAAFRYNNYLNRFHWRHIDLMDVLAGYQSRAAAPLDEIAVMLGLPGTAYHLEFTHHVAGSPCPAPTRDNLLVLYFDSSEQARLAAARLEAHGGTLAAAENPYWTSNGAITVEDPDGWRVVLAPRPVF